MPAPRHTAAKPLCDIAGSPPATMMLARMLAPDLRSGRDRPRPRRMCITKKVGSAAPMSSIIPSGRIRPSQARHPHRSNRHSVRHRQRPPIAVSFLGGFRTPALVHVERSVGRHPKPFTCSDVLSRMVYCATLRTEYWLTQSKSVCRNVIHKRIGVVD